QVNNSAEWIRSKVPDTFSDREPLRARSDELDHRCRTGSALSHQKPAFALEQVAPGGAKPVHEEAAHLDREPQAGLVLDSSFSLGNGRVERSAKCLPGFSPGLHTHLGSKVR